jgi:hypothetical protein
MTRSEIYREVLHLDEQLKIARRQVKEAQMRARVTGTKLPGREYTAMWEHIHHLERTIETTRLRLSSAEETSAERFLAIVKADYPAVFAQVASRAGVE